MKFQALLKSNPDFAEQNGLFIQKSNSKFQFEDHYIALRKSEGRIYSNDVVRNLPDIASSHPLSREWRIRKKSLEKLCRYIQRKRPDTILEVGCGNGWLIQNLACRNKSDCCGVDINSTELVQAACLFGSQSNVCFVLGDIESTLFDGEGIDMIILASALQYFKDPNLFLSKLKRKLSAKGEIHIVDTPFYDGGNVPEARSRSEQYFQRLQAPSMTNFYFHHTWNSISAHSHTVKYNPGGFWRRIASPLFDSSPFPWIIFPQTNISL